MYKVLTVVGKLNLGGIEKTLLGCIDVFQSDKIEMHILCERGGKLDQKFLEKNVVLHYYTKTRLPFFKLIDFVRVVIQNEIKIAHLRNGHTSGLYALAGKLLNIFIIVSIHNETAMFKKKWQNKLVLGKVRLYYLSVQRSLIAKFSNKIIGHSKANLNYYKSFFIKFPSKFAVIYNGVDFSKLDRENNSKKINKNHFKLIHIGSFKHQKNHQMLIQIFKNLVYKGFDISLDLCGEGELMEEIKDLSKGFDIVFHGNVDNLSDLLNKADLLLFPSYHEGFGNVNIEAQYMKVAVCCSDINPHYESVFNKYHKYFFPLDSVEIATEKCALLLNEMTDTEFEIILNEAHEFSLDFANVHMAKKISKIYTDVI